MTKIKLPPISDEDRQHLSYNPNTDDLVDWITEYATRAVIVDRAQRDAEHLAELRAYELTVAHLREQLAQRGEPACHTLPSNIKRLATLETTAIVASLPYSTPDESSVPLYTIQQAPQVPMTEDEIVKCLVESSCIGKVMMSFESGPYDITRTSINADRLVRAIEAHHGIKEKP